MPERSERRRGTAGQQGPSPARARSPITQDKHRRPWVPSGTLRRSVDKAQEEKDEHDPESELLGPLLTVQNVQGNIRRKRRVRDVGDRVEARCAGGSKWVSGVVERVNQDGTLAIVYENGVREGEVQPTNVRRAPETRRRQYHQYRSSDEEKEDGSAPRAHWTTTQTAEKDNLDLGRTQAMTTGRHHDELMDFSRTAASNIVSDALADMDSDEDEGMGMQRSEEDGWAVLAKHSEAESSQRVPVSPPPSYEAPPFAVADCRDDPSELRPAIRVEHALHESKEQEDEIRRPIRGVAAGLGSHEDILYSVQRLQERHREERETLEQVLQQRREAQHKRESAGENPSRRERSERPRTAPAPPRVSARPERDLDVFDLEADVPLPDRRLVNEPDIQRRVERSGHRHPRPMSSRRPATAKSKPKPRTVKPPKPFLSMEMDIANRQHKKRESDMAKAREEEEEQQEADRKFQRALRAQPQEVHIRLSRDYLSTLDKLEERRKEENDKARQSSNFRAIPYAGDEGEDWLTRQAKKEVERQQSIAKWTQEWAKKTRAPRMTQSSKENVHGDRRKAPAAEPKVIHRKTLEPEDVRKQLERRRRKWDAHMTEIRSQIRGQTTKPHNPLEARQKQYKEKQAERRRRDTAKHRAEEQRRQLLEERKKQRKLNLKMPEKPRSTHAADLKVQRAREKQELEEKQKAREAARQANRERRLKEAGKALRPILDEFDRARRRTQEPAAGGVSLKEKMRENRKHIEDKVRLTRPSLIDRLTISSAKEKARARVLHAVSETIKDIYTGGKDGKEDSKWIREAMEDELLQPAEVAYLAEMYPDVVDEVRKDISRVGIEDEMKQSNSQSYRGDEETKQEGKEEDDEYGNEKFESS